MQLRLAIPMTIIAALLAATCAHYPGSNQTLDPCNNDACSKAAHDKGPNCSGQCQSTSGPCEINC
jgi:hypothetical protein